MSCSSYVLVSKRVNSLEAPSAEDKCYLFPSLDCTSEENASNKHSCCMVLRNMES